MIGNLLSTRKYEVVLVDKTGERWIRLPAAARKEEEQIEIESLIIPEVVHRHEECIRGAAAARGAFSEQGA